MKITTETAQAMTDAYTQARIGLKAPNGKTINSFFLSRAEIEAMLSDTSKTGIRIHLAKNPGSAPKEITLVFTGSTTVIPEMTAADTTPGDTYGNPPPCPTVCN